MALPADLIPAWHADRSRLERWVKHWLKAQGYTVDLTLLGDTIESVILEGLQLPTAGKRTAPPVPHSPSPDRHRVPFTGITC